VTDERNAETCLAPTQASAAAHKDHPRNNPIHHLLSFVDRMQRSDLQFLFSELPDRCTQKLLCSYLSLFGEVESCSYDAAARCATASFSSSIDPDKIMNVRHRFLGMPIAVNRLPPASAGPSSEVVSALSVHSSPSSASPFVALHDASISVVPAPGDAKHIPVPPGSRLCACRMHFPVPHALFQNNSVT